MEPVSEYKIYYLASILLRSSSYEGELNEQILRALRSSPSASRIAAPRILLNTPNRRFFIDRFLSELAHLPFAVEIITPEQEVGQQIDGYEEGRPDPVDPAGTWRAMSLDIRMELGGKRDAKLFLSELQSGELVMISFAFDPSTVKGGRWHNDDSLKQESDLPRFREFLLSLTEVYPVLIGTLGFDLDAVAAGLPDDELRLENRMSLHQLTSAIRQEGHEYSFDLAIINPAASGGNKPFVYDCIEPRKSVQEIEAGGRYHDLRLVEELRVNAERAEQAYDRMYESHHPKDDRDDALGFLSKAIGLAGSLGLAQIEGGLKSRYEHINEVFNSQFRR